MANKELAEKQRTAYRKLLRELADDIEDTDFVKLKEEVKGKKGFGKAVLQTTKTTLQFFSLMENTGNLSQDNTEYLKELLENVDRENLCPKVDAYNKMYQGMPSSSAAGPTLKREREPSPESSPGVMGESSGAPNPGTSSDGTKADYPDWFTECNNPLDIHVTKCMNYMKEKIMHKQGPVYDLSNKAGIKVIIINNKKFTERPKGVKHTRHGTHVDKERLVKVFTELGFTNVDIKENQTGPEILGIMDTEVENATDGFICVILSHGDLGIVYGTDWIGVSIPDIYSKFLGDKCRKLVGKPKIFLIQACLGRQQDRGAEAIDSGSGTGAVQFPWTNTLPTGSDLLVAFSTMPGFASIRHHEYGSWFINALVSVLMKKAHKDHLLDILTEVNRLVSELATVGSGNIIRGGKQGCMCLTSLRQRLYFFPGL